MTLPNVKDNLVWGGTGLNSHISEAGTIKCLASVIDFQQIVLCGFKIQLQSNMTLEVEVKMLNK